MVAAGTIGYTLGSLAGWGIGDYGGRPLVERHGRWFHLSPERFARAERWFDRWGGEAVFLGRITPIVRSFVSIPAGVFRHPLGRYTLLTFAGSTLWCLAFAGIGWAVGENWESFHHAFALRRVRRSSACSSSGLGYLVLRWRSSRLNRRASDSSL